jgi:NAD dependent epimerase/dehydratase family
VIAATAIPGRAELVEGLEQAAAPHLEQLEPTELTHLAEATNRLIHYYGEGAFRAFSEFGRTAYRRLGQSVVDSYPYLNDEVVVVTGGTGCIGSALLEELSQLHPARLVSVARGRIEPPVRIPGVEYMQADVRSTPAVERIFMELRPGAVFHLAAQRNPGQAEVEVAETVTTNVLGTRNVVEAARRCGVRVFVYASTGKAMHFYTPSVYAASKKAGEWIVARTGRGGQMACGIARFTHVVDNSLIRRRVADWLATQAPIRLHSPHLAFYRQSALESAQLLIGAGLEASPGAAYVHAMRDLGNEVGLLDFALGAEIALDRRCPVYVCGFEAGYSEEIYPALYDPQKSVSFTMLFNGLEAALAEPSSFTPGVDRFHAPLFESVHATECLEELDLSCLKQCDSSELKVALSDLSWSIFAARLPGFPEDARRRALSRIEGVMSRAELADEDTRTTEAIRESLAA